METIQSFRENPFSKLLRRTPRRLWQALFPDHPWSLKYQYDQPLGPASSLALSDFHHTLLLRNRGSGILDLLELYPGLPAIMPAGLPYGPPAELPDELSEDLPRKPVYETPDDIPGCPRPHHWPVDNGPSHNLTVVMPPRLKSCIRRPCIRRTQPLRVTFSDPISENREIQPREDRKPEPYVPIRDTAIRQMRYASKSRYCSVCKIFRRFRGWHTCPLHSDLAKWTIVPPVPGYTEGNHLCRCQMDYALPGHVFCTYCEQGGAISDDAVAILQEIGLCPGIKADATFYSGLSRQTNFVAWHRELIAQGWRPVAA